MLWKDDHYIEWFQFLFQEKRERSFLFSQEMLLKQHLLCSGSKDLCIINTDFGWQKLNNYLQKWKEGPKNVLLCVFAFPVFVVSAWATFAPCYTTIVFREKPVIMSIGGIILKPRIPHAFSKFLHWIPMYIFALTILHMGCKKIHMCLEYLLFK